MASLRMCGVVLWASHEDGRAVIWCEDHGKLAFYAARSGPTDVGNAALDMQVDVILDAGDLIEFDVEDHAQQRLARNPTLLVQDHAPKIATGLQAQSRATTHAPRAPRSGAAILPFRPRQSDDRQRACG